MIIVDFTLTLVDLILIGTKIIMQLDILMDIKTITIITIKSQYIIIVNYNVDIYCFLRLIRFMDSIRNMDLLINYPLSREMGLLQGIFKGNNVEGPLAKGHVTLAPSLGVSIYLLSMFLNLSIKLTL